MVKHLNQMYTNITTEAIELFMFNYLVCQEKKKRAKTTELQKSITLDPTDYGSPKLGNNSPFSLFRRERKQYS